MWWGLGPESDNLVLEPIPSWMCANEDVEPLRGVDCNIPHRQGEWIMYALYVYSHLYLARGLLVAHWLRVPLDFRKGLVRVP